MKLPIYYRTILIFMQECGSIEVLVSKVKENSQ